MTSPQFDEQGEVIIPEEEDSIIDDLFFGKAPAKKEVDDEETPEFAVTRSDFIGLLRGESLIYGPLRRTVTIADGPFIVLEDGEERVEIEAPEPIEYRREPQIPEPSPESLYQPAPEELKMREKIRNVLRDFVDGLGIFPKRGGAGSGHHGHAGRPGEVGGSAPSGVREVAGDFVTDPTKDYIITKEGTAVSLSPERETFLDEWRRENVLIQDEAAEEIKFYKEQRGFGAGTRFAREIDSVDLHNYGEEWNRFFITPWGNIILVRDHDVVAEHVVETLFEKYTDEFLEIEDNLGEVGGFDKDMLITMGFVRGGWRQSRARGATPDAIDELNIQFEAPMDRKTRNTIKDLLALNENMVVVWDHSTSDNRVQGQHREDLEKLIERTLEEKGGEGSGHHGHAGRPGEVGGSAPSKYSKGQRVTFGQSTGKGVVQTPAIITGIGEKDGKVTYDLEVAPEDDINELGGEYWSYERDVNPTKGVRETTGAYEWENPEYGSRVEKTVSAFEEAVGSLPSNVRFITDDVDAVIEKIIELEDTEDDPMTDEDKETVRNDLKKKLRRVVGANIPANWGDDIVIYMSEEKSVGSYVFNTMRGERTITADPEEVEYVISHELGHAVMKEEGMEHKMRGALLDYLINPSMDEKYPHRKEQTLVPHSYANALSGLYKDMGAIESEYYADMIGYAVRLQSNPADTRLSIGGDREIDIEFDWAETDEPPKEVALMFLDVLKKHYGEGGDA